MKKKTDWFIIVVLLICFGAAAFFGIAAVRNARLIPAAVEKVENLIARWESGDSVTGTAERTGKEYMRDRTVVHDVMLHYTVEGTDYSESAVSSYNAFQTLDGKDKDGFGELEIRYDPADPSVPVTQLEISAENENLSRIRRAPWISGIIAAVFAVVGIAIIAVFTSENRSRKQKSYDSGSRNGNSFVRANVEQYAAGIAHKELKQPLEDYAIAILELYEDEMPWEQREPELRKIGEKIDHHDNQMLVAYRARYLCGESFKDGCKSCGEFSLRDLEYAWDGLGGWMK